MNRLLALFCMTFISMAAHGEDRFANVQIKTIEITDGIYMLMGAGGNIGVSVGDDGLLIIDDQYAPLSEKIKSALSELSTTPPLYLINTHYHGDHTGGNENFAADSLIMAHENVRNRLTSEEDFAATALPVITYKQQMNIHFNGEDVRLVFMPAGHTDGDSIVYFTRSNVVHMGDHYFKDRFPYVDLDAGGTVDGLIVNIKGTLETIGENTQVIPGHGKLANRTDLENYYDMLVGTSMAVKLQINAGKSIDEILGSGLDSMWDSWAAGFISEERWIRTLYKSYSEG